jgi:nucleoid-associated protein YgaU
VLRLTRLHLLLAGIGFVSIFLGVLNWIGENEDATGRKALTQAEMLKATAQQRMARVKQQGSSALDHLHRNASVSLATVGESYRLLSRQYGDIPPISRPLRAGKDNLVRCQDQEALENARIDWQALKSFQKKAESASGGYQVVRGDTLWRIARTHSPVRSGAGWVTIWKANKNTVPNFNRLEVGWTLEIPPERSQYAMPFWKPQ